MLHYYWNCLYLGDFLMKEFFSTAELGVSVSDLTVSLVQQGRCYLIWAACPLLKNIFTFCLQVVGEGNKFSRCLAVAPKLKAHSVCVSAPRSPAARQVCPRWGWGCPHCEGTTAEDRGQGTVQGEACPVSALPVESGCAPHHKVLWIAGMCLCCAGGVEGCLMACLAFQTDLMLLP